jgi:hypothetical protein
MDWRVWAGYLFIRLADWFREIDIFSSILWFLDFDLSFILSIDESLGYFGLMLVALNGAPLSRLLEVNVFFLRDY